MHKSHLKSKNIIIISYLGIHDKIIPNVYDNGLVFDIILI